jgi:hypothetical protein
MTIDEKLQRIDELATCQLIPLVAPVRRSGRELTHLGTCHTDEDAEFLQLSANAVPDLRRLLNRVRCVCATLKQEFTAALSNTDGDRRERGAACRAADRIMAIINGVEA